MAKKGTTDDQQTMSILNHFSLRRTNFGCDHQAAVNAGYKSGYNSYNRRYFHKV